jgi:putative ABC transport system ATP-binding protein
MSESPAVLIENLKFAYHRGQPVLDIREFSLRRGERLFLHGPSGTGKTTLLGLLAGILEADSGRIEILGRSYDSLRGTDRDHFRGSHIGYIFQMFNLIPYLNVRDNIELPCLISRERHDRLKGQDLHAAASEIAAHLEIGELLPKKVTDLSVGQQQRVAAARALMGAPELVIADEPTSALDTDRREIFLRLLFREAERTGATILFVSHDHTLAPLFSRTVSLRDINQARTSGPQEARV